MNILMSYKMSDSGMCTRLLQANKYYLTKKRKSVKPKVARIFTSLPQNQSVVITGVLKNFILAIMLKNQCNICKVYTKYSCKCSNQCLLVQLESVGLQSHYIQALWINYLGPHPIVCWSYQQLVNELSCSY